MHSQDEFITKMGQELADHLTRPQQKGLVDFLSRFFAIITEDDINNYRRRDLVASTLASWRFLLSYKAEAAQVEVLNPDYENDGWHSTHTIIQIAQRDMPFLIDSVRMKLNELGITIHQLRNCAVTRAKAGKGKGEQALAMLYIEVDRQAEEQDRETLRQLLSEVLVDVARAVSDYQPICQRVQELANSFSESEGGEIAEIHAYLTWLLDNNFTFLAYEELKLDYSGKDPVVRQVEGESLGLLKEHAQGRLHRGVLEPGLDSHILGDSQLLSFAKAAARSSVHRPAYPDFILLKHYDDDGRVIGEYRIMGLYTSPVYSQSPRTIPLLRNKVAGIAQMSGFPPESHHGKELMQILEVYPREEMFLTPMEQLFSTAMSIVQIQERNQVRVFSRRDVNSLFCSVLVYVPRELYDTKLRIRMQNILCEKLNAVDSEFTTYFSESTLARVHYILRLSNQSPRDVNARAIAAEIQQAAYSWELEFRDVILESKGEVEGNVLLKTFREAFPVSYRDEFSALTAVADVEHMLPLNRDQRLAMSFYQPMDEDGLLHFKVFHHTTELSLSSLIPIMENLGLEVLGEHPYHIRLNGSRRGEKIWLHDFTLSQTYGVQIPLRKVASRFQETFQKVWYGQAENDKFNRLVLSVGLDWRQVNMLRAYARYMKQIRFGLSQDYIAETLRENCAITLLLVQMFEVSFNPGVDLTIDQRKARRQQLQQTIIDALDGVSILSQDRVLRRFMELMVATQRTNFYQHNSQGEYHDYVSYKFTPRSIPNIPKPVPLFEIFVYSPYVEGVHLRGGKVARGGLRWSDRMEDFRTEVLGLVKAQQVKNAVIVPVGAKGGFVPKMLPANGTREQIHEEGVRCYKTFIRALLGITDNLKDSAVVYPEQVVRYDEDDTYLVVAADKGTATFSDIANGIAAEHDFWLGDAFASGGSVGYDHKKMGITARGAWVSVQRHFRERNLDVQKQPITVVGIGDMAGDVFGNGLLSSNQLKLVAAFNHLHIFVDPTPDPATSFAERERLFNLPRSSWEDYNHELISAGGGVFSRQAKAIAISPEMAQLFDIKGTSLPPNELLSAILRAPVDLIWNGGIGTYIKSSQESHSDVGDKANDSLRIDGHEVRAKVIGEGGNLGATQLGRIEYALGGGALNTDFIDNAGGVDCSDHEVNIKILLNQLVAAGDMTRKQRDKLLESMTEDVSRLVLANNYRQTQAITMAEAECLSQMEEYKGFIHDLEERGRLDRLIEFLPDNEVINERQQSGKGLTRPELSVLISYSKADLKETLLASDIPDDAYLARELRTAFPPQLVDGFGEALAEHRLNREIVATQLANYLINMMGITFVNRQQKSTGVNAPKIVRSFVIARDIFDGEQLWSDIESLDYVIGNELQQELMGEVMRLLRRATRWLLRVKALDRDTDACVEHYAGRIGSLMANLATLLPEQQRLAWEKRVGELTEQGVPELLAQRIAAVRHLFSLLSVVHAVDQTGQPLERVASLFFALGEHLKLPEFLQQLSQLKMKNQWHSLAREGIRDELALQQRALTMALLTLPDAEQDVSELIARWSDSHASALGRWHDLLNELRGEAARELAVYTVAIQELCSLAQQR